MKHSAEYHAAIQAIDARDLELDEIEKQLQESTKLPSNHCFAQRRQMWLFKL
jgi:hypothetical protein